MSIANLKRIIIFYNSQYIIIYEYYRGLKICNFRYYYQYTFSSMVILVFLTIISYYKIMKDKKALYEEQAKIFHALANPVRLYIINELSDKEYCLCELTGKIPLINQRYPDILRCSVMQVLSELGRKETPFIIISKFIAF